MRRQALYIDFSNVTQLICFLRYITWFYSDKDEKLVAVEQELWKERNNVKLPVCFSLASGNLQTRVGLPWVEGEDRYCVYMWPWLEKGNFTLCLEPLVLQQVSSWIFCPNSWMSRGWRRKRALGKGCRGSLHESVLQVPKPVVVELPSLLHLWKYSSFA